jgi:hypothetical protein
MTAVSEFFLPSINEQNAKNGPFQKKVGNYPAAAASGYKMLLFAPDEVFASFYCTEFPNK